MSCSSNLRTSRRSFLLALLALPFAGSGHASMPAGLRRWGSGTFRRFGFLVYQATLWAGEDPLRPPLALRLDYKRSIAGTAIAEASVKEMRQLVSDEQQLDLWGEQMAQIFPDVRDGDHILGVWQADGVRFLQGDRMLGSVADAEFARAFFGIWLDEQTSAPELRAALLRPPAG
jgi:hypothetical protein